MAFPESPSKVVSALARIFAAQGRPDLSSLLQQANADFQAVGAEGYNSDTTIWAFRLRVPVELFASIEPRLQEIEHEIHEKVKHFDREHLDDRLATTTIVPALDEGSGPSAFAPSQQEVERLWDKGRFRLFLSHISAHKVFAVELKDHLRDRGVAAFVAHDDIEPAHPWQQKIEMALASMHALASLHTPKFTESQWTDQEVGWALGRRLLVLPVRIGADPRGFVARVQGLPGHGVAAEVLARDIVRTLIDNALTHSTMRCAILDAFENAPSVRATVAVAEHLETMIALTPSEMEQVKKGCDRTASVNASPGLADRVANRFGIRRKSLNPVQIDDDVPF